MDMRSECLKFYLSHLLQLFAKYFSRFYLIQFNILMVVIFTKTGKIAHL